MAKATDVMAAAFSTAQKFEVGQTIAGTEREISHWIDRCAVIGDVEGRTSIWNNDGYSATTTAMLK